ncbi:uncharacterized protein LOC142212858 isoform X1 [Leptodactylus fuscus]|uniref:uncharacterized protein LOC142212858 isoform X1 n=1 Tax=Leptodactylus fuscus TaxID=238119 RepID=UPI003F4EDCD3
MKEPTHPLYLLLMLLVTADGLTVTMKAPLISVLREVNVTIPCDISDFIPGKTINVRWTKSQNGQDLLVYTYTPGQRIPSRPGSYMEEDREIQKGNAALHIPQVQFSDDGEYTCYVIVTPEGAEGRSSLQVSALPSAVLIPGDVVTVELGSERSVSCEVSNFYPKDTLNIRWVRHEKDSPKYVLLERETCIGESINNTDGTFNTTSHLTLYPTMENNGYKYSCVVKHRSLRQDLMMGFTLTVTEREDNTGTVVTAVLLTLFAVTLLLFAVLLYYQVFKKDPPVLSEIIGSDHLTDMTRMTLTCHIMNFKPNNLEISVCLKRPGKEVKTILTWRSLRDPESSARVMMSDNGGDSSAAIDIEQRSLMNGDVSPTQRPLQLDMSPVITPDRPRLLRCIPWHRLSTYSCQCSVHITPSFYEDNGAEFSVQVSHPALTAPVYQKRTLQASGVAPALLRIVSPVYMTHGKPMTLTCPIIGFKPKPLQITWLRKDKNNEETEIITWNSNDGTDVRNNIHKLTENEHEDKSYSVQSALKITPTVMEDDGATYICRTHHPATDKRVEEALVMAVTAVPVLDPIRLVEDKVHVGDKMNLSCRIHSFYPKPIEAKWYTEDGQSLPSDTTDVLCDPSGLYHLTSSMTYSPTLKDLGKTFTCKVRHESTGALRTTTWRLEDLVSAPSVSEISCSPPTPKSCDMVTLSCDVSDLYPPEINVQWYKGLHKISQDNYKQRESKPYQGTIEVKFTVDSGCHEQDFRMELNHCGKPIERKFRLILGGHSSLPVLSDITSDPSNPSYGQSVTLRCKVTNCNPQDTEVKWLKGEKPLEKGQGVEKRIPEKDGSLSCSLQITATALDYGRSYTCCVIYKGTIVRKNIYVTLPDKPPVFSAISVRPERPVAGEEAEFTVTISGFTPDIKVKWYKDFSTFPSDAITTSDLQIGRDSLCTCSSTLRFTPQPNDDKASIRCEATHSVTKKVHEQTYTLNLAGRTSDEAGKHFSSTRPDSGQLKLRLRTKGIQCLTESPRVGDKVTLTCYVDGCDADYSEFAWRRGMYPINGDIKNENLEDGSGSFSTVTFTAQETDRDCRITCEVNYDYETLEEHFTLKLL